MVICNSPFEKLTVPPTLEGLSQTPPSDPSPVPLFCQKPPGCKKRVSTQQGAAVSFSPGKIQERGRSLPRQQTTTTFGFTFGILAELTRLNPAAYAGRGGMILWVGTDMQALFHPFPRRVWWRFFVALVKIWQQVQQSGTTPEIPRSLLTGP